MRDEITKWINNPEKIELDTNKVNGYLERRIKLRDELEDLTECLYKIEELDVGKSMEYLYCLPDENKHKLLKNMELIEHIKLELVDINDDIDKLIQIIEMGYWWHKR